MVIIVEGIVFSRKVGEWIIACKSPNSKDEKEGKVNRVKIIVDKDLDCPAEKGDLFFGVCREPPKPEPPPLPTVNINANCGPLFLKINGITTRKEYLDFMRKNHPDRNPNQTIEHANLVQEISNAFTSSVWIPERNKIEWGNDRTSLIERARIINEENAIEREKKRRERGGKEKEGKGGKDLILVSQPIVKISLENSDIKDMMKKSFRCGGQKAENLFFNLLYEAQVAQQDIKDYIDEMIACFIRVPSEDVFSSIFPYVDKEAVIRFFKKWNFTMGRRFGLIGVEKSILKDVNMAPSVLYARLTENPFTVPEVDLETAKKVCERIGKEYTPQELKCGEVVRHLYQSLNSGFTYTTYNAIQQRFPLSTEEFYLLENSYNVTANRLNGRVSLSSIVNVNDKVATLLYQRLKGDFPKREIQTSTTRPVDLTQEQKFAVVASLMLPMTIITGCGGSGKSTVIGEIFSYEPKCMLMSFTGKAVARLNEIINPLNYPVPPKEKEGKGKEGEGEEPNQKEEEKKASTIHKLLSILDLPVDVKHVIVDEATMVDTELMYRFLITFPYPKYNYRLTFVGDPNQLPPTKWGAFFEQLLDSGKVPVFRLNKNMRIKSKKEENGIRMNLDKLLEHKAKMDSQCMVIPFHLETYPNFVMRKGGVDEVAKILVGRKNLGFPIDDTIILTPYNDCAKEINEKCQYLLMKGKHGIVDSVGTKWYIGNPVCNRVNNYGKGVMNGERGVIHDIVDNKLIVKIRNNYILYSTKVMSTYTGKNYLYEGKTDLLNEDEFTNTGTLRLDYASTVHSAQGSEWNNVIIYVPMGHKANSSFVDFNLTYTMISRAKKKVWIVGDIDMLNVSCTLTKPKKKDEFLEKFLACFSSPS